MTNKIVKALEKDATVLEDIFSSLYKAELKWSKEIIKNNMVNNKVEYYIIFDEDPVGAIALKFDNKECEIDAFAIKIKGKGYGFELLKFLEDLALKDGYKKVWCYSLDIYNARDFYKRYGWKEDKLIKNLFENKDGFVYSKILI